MKYKNRGGKKINRTENSKTKTEDAYDRRIIRPKWSWATRRMYEVGKEYVEMHHSTAVKCSKDKKYILEKWQADM